MLKSGNRGAAESAVPSGKVRESRERILAATFRVVARDAISGTRVPSIAIEAGVSQGILFYHFETKEKLLLSLLDWLLDAFRNYRGIVSERSIKPPTPPEPAAVQSAFLAYLRLLIEHEREMISVFYDFWVQAVSRRGPFEQLLQDQFRIYRNDVKGVLAKRLRDHPDADVTAGIIVSLFEGAALQLTLDPDAFDMDAYLVRTGEILRGCS